MRGGHKDKQKKIPDFRKHHGSLTGEAHLKLYIEINRPRPLLLYHRQ